MDSWLIKNARIMDPSRPGDSGREELGDLRIVDGVIAEIGRNLPVGDGSGADNDGGAVINADGLICAPGLVDIHVHLRDSGIGDGGQPQKEDMFSGTAAAAAGGITSLCCMPNTVPPADSPEVLQAIRSKATAANVRVYPAAAVTIGQNGERLTDFEALKAAGAAALSDDGRPVPSADLMEQAMRRAKEVGLPLLSHCEELSLVRGGIMHEGTVSQALEVPGIARAAEEVAVAREIALAAATGCPVHICHVSTAGAVALIRDARRRGVPVTAETAPHYLLATHELLEQRDADYRMNPPLREAADAEALITGLQDGTLTVIATDHAPHAAEEKADFLTAPPGVTGLETALAACMTALVVPGKLPLRRLLELMSTEPARLLGIPAGTLTIGAPADIILFDPKESWVVHPSKLRSRGRSTALKGLRLNGSVKMTLVGGRVVYQIRRSRIDFTL
ncbi:MAG: dihydroorotase [Oscillospiraceae bacterium]|nr:dihydroorotase [Oscillospiraceae bacterium]